MQQPEPMHPARLQTETEQPLIGVVVEEQGLEFVRYFGAEAAADAATSEGDLAAALSVIGAFGDLDWDEMEDALDRIRHESTPSPPFGGP